MDKARRELFNAVDTDRTYATFMRRLESKVGPIPFRVAETPLLFTHELRDRLTKHALEIVGQLSRPELLARLRQAVPAHYDVPGVDALPQCMQVDFALIEGADGRMDGRVVELQAFPSLYALMILKAETWAETMQEIPGLALDWTWALNGDPKRSVEMLRDTLLDGNDPEEVVLVDLEPEQQKTSPDFVATQKLFGVDSVCVTRLIKRGRKLYRVKNGREIQVKRIYNRMVFDELEVKKAPVPFAWNEELDVTWCSHPNWYWTWSKFSLPHLNHPSVPKARFLDEVTDPGDLTYKVLKPLFSYAGSGVKVDVTPADLDAVPAEQRHGWVLQDKIRYAEAVRMPDGNGVKAEVRIMLLRTPGSRELTPYIPLVRMSRGKMLGVDYNKGLTWVGGSVGIWAR